MPEWRFEMKTVDVQAKLLRGNTDVGAVGVRGSEKFTQQSKWASIHYF
jgi:hypothetical protein